MLLKRAQKKQLPLVTAVKKLQTELLEPLNRDASANQPEFARVQQAKKVVLFLLGAAYQKFATNIEEQQQVLAGIADAMMAAFALESSVLRWLKATSHNGEDIARGYCLLIANQAFRELERAATEVMAACSEGDELRAGLALLRKLTRGDTVDAIGIRRQVAGKLLEAGRYIV
jgi:butyryl-CoA dehydrogenase